MDVPTVTNRFGFADNVELDHETPGKIDAFIDRVFVVDYRVPYSGSLNLAPMPGYALLTPAPVLDGDIEPRKPKQKRVPLNLKPQTSAQRRAAKLAVVVRNNLARLAAGTVARVTATGRTAA